MDKETEHMKRHYEHIQSHWKFTLIGSAVGFGAIVAELLYRVATNQLYKFVGDDLIETVTGFIVLIIFVFFLRLGIIEYEDIKNELKSSKEAEQDT
jgi:predicted membrane protein